MIAVALGLISLVVMIATGVVISSSTEDHLTFLGVGIQATTAQVFVTGAIFGWLFLMAIWLLRIGLHRSGERCEELAARRRRRPSNWLGFGDWDDVGDGGEPERVADRERNGWRGSRMGGVSGASGVGSTGSVGHVGRTGTTRHGGSTPWRAHGRLDDANRAVTAAPDQSGLLNGDYAPRPITSRFPGINVNGGAQRGQVGGGPGPVPGKDGRPQSEHRPGDGGQ